ncbi:MAG: nucleotidyltransferase domain-containing protein [Anaerolinea sp.]|nr:nucleotidyltransferase domain-containing protein [Anaerolinea sp.]
MNDSFGLRSEDLATLIAILAQYPAVQTALIFGSRAKGNYKPGSDVDIALQGDEVTDRIAAEIAYHLNEDTLMPYHFDVLNYRMIANPDLVAHIDRVGVPFYTAVAKPNKRRYSRTPKVKQTNE